MNKTIKSIALIVAIIVLNACATSPDNIASSYISPLQYQHYTCAQIAREIGNLERRVSSAHETLDSKATGDMWKMGVGLVLLWPVLFALDGDDQTTAEFSRLKGEYEALEKISSTKNCYTQPIR